jgi:hypothetical protein
MSFLYPRTVAVHRSSTVAAQSPGVGLTGYSGREQSTNSADAEGETVLFTGLPASIQAKRANARNPRMPTDVADKPMWVILIPAVALAQYSIRDRDILVDDESYRYQVAQAYWNSLGYALNCIRLEA